MRRPVKPFVTEYKAASRRARTGSDDLFAQTGGDAGHDSAGRGENAYDAAMKAADALFSPAADKEREPQHIARAAKDAPALNAGSAPAGRILRAIEVPSPAEDHARLDNLPKKRGRKPGSKNKPKLGEPALGSVALLPAATGDDAPAIQQDPGDQEGAQEIAPARSSVPYLRAGERFPWVRTKLKPGEHWKRRLPKVCW